MLIGKYVKTRYLKKIASIKKQTLADNIEPKKGTCEDPICFKVSFFLSCLKLGVVT